ncbi:MAG TPA: glycosyltransferase [Chromatiaceae bacterium]|nr:glycosyltransferase [Chromatiaceae bacterium]
MQNSPLSHTTPLVSVCLSTSDWGKHIDQAIDSILLQTYWNWELVIVRDRSNPGISDILDRYQKRYSDRIRLLEIESTHRYEAAVMCLSQSRGRFIAIMACGDLLEPNQLSYEVAYLKCYPGINAVRALSAAATPLPGTPKLFPLDDLMPIVREGQMLYGPSMLARTTALADMLPTLLGESASESQGERLSA